MFLQLLVRWVGSPSFCFGVDAAGGAKKTNTQAAVRNTLDTAGTGPPNVVTTWFIFHSVSTPDVAMKPLLTSLAAAISCHYAQKRTEGTKCSQCIKKVT